MLPCQKTKNAIREKQFSEVSGWSAPPVGREKSFAVILRLKKNVIVVGRNFITQA